MILHLSAFKSLSLVPIYFVVFVKMKREDLRALIEQEIFKGRPYGFTRLNLTHISEAIVANVGKREQRCIKLCDVNDPASQKRVEKSVKSSAQVLIDSSEIQRRVTPGRKERYFP